MEMNETETKVMTSISVKYSAMKLLNYKLLKSLKVEDSAQFSVGTISQKAQK